MYREKEKTHAHTNEQNRWIDRIKRSKKLTGAIRNNSLSINLTLIKANQKKNVCERETSNIRLMALKRR